MPWRLVAGATALVIAAGCGLTGRREEVQAAPVAEATQTPPSSEPTPEPSVTSSPTPRPTKTSRKPTKKPTSAGPTMPPFWSQLPPCAHYDKTKPVSKAKVKAALKAAAGRIYWRTEAPELRLNYPLVKAVAWQESGWQSNIHNCDGGMGIMQVMPGTVAHMNSRFGLAYEPSDYRDNAYVGANYLAWLTRWAGQRYFKDSHDLSPRTCRSVTSWCLLNVVIAGYQAGQGGIEAAAAGKRLPNPAYVAAVRALMTRCQCDRY